MNRSNFPSSKKSSRRLEKQKIAKDVFKTYSKCIQHVPIKANACWEVSLRNIYKCIG